MLEKITTNHCEVVCTKAMILKDAMQQQGVSSSVNDYGLLVEDCCIFNIWIGQGEL